MNRVIFDIETGPLPAEKLANVMPEFRAPSNWKDPEKIAANIREQREEWVRDAALSAVTGRVLAIGIMDNTRPEPIILHAMDEQNTLRTFWLMWVSERKGAEWVGFNCLGFDMPFLLRRSWALRVPVPRGVRVQGARYWDPRLVDLMDVWQCGDRQSRASLDVVAKSLGLPGKNGNGADFARLYAEEPEQAMAYLRNDLLVTKEVADVLL